MTNTFTAAESKITIDENVENGEKSSIQVKNIGTATSYVRVKLVMNWVDDATENIVSGDNLPTVELNTDDGWFEKGDIYYYKTPVAPKDLTANLLKDPITQTNAPEGCHLEVTVLAESIQAAPSTAVEGAWKVVKVGQDSCLTLKDTTTP